MFFFQNRMGPCADVTHDLFLTGEHERCYVSDLSSLTDWVFSRPY